MTLFSINKWVLLITIVIIIEGCVYDQKKENIQTHIAAIAKFEIKLHFLNNDETNGGEDFQMKLWKTGIDFYARGNEPFWALDMDIEKGFYFKTLDGIEIITLPVKGEKAMDANNLRFYSETDSVSLIITILEEECNDTMSDEVFPNKVKIEVRQLNDEEFKVYEGCGRYVADYGLHDIWVLTHLNGKDLSSHLDKEKRLPVFEFYAREGKVLGNGGCNDFHGNYYISGMKEIQFGEMTLTKKLCSEMDIENLLIKTLFGKRMKYQREDLKLTLSGYDGSELILKKID